MQNCGMHSSDVCKKGFNPSGRSESVRTAAQVEIRVKALLARLHLAFPGIFLCYESDRSGTKKSNGAVGIQQPHAFCS